MRFEKFEDIIVWQKAQKLCLDIYEYFSWAKDYGFKYQIQRAVVSISNNIAEGYERKSNPEFTKFLFIAKGSCGEVRSMLYLAKSLKFINEAQFIVLKDETLEISRMLSALIKTLQKNHLDKLATK